MGQLVFQATAGGQVALVGPNPSSNFSLNVPAVNGNLVTTGDTGTVTNTMLAASAYTAPGTIGSGTPNSGAFTTLSASSTVSGTGFSTYLASPPAIGGTTPSTGKFTSITNTGLTATQVIYATTGGLETSSANMTFNGTSLTLANDASISGLTVGKGGGSVNFNTAIGNNAMAATASGVVNTAVGAYALNGLLAGLDNTAVGGNSLQANTSGNYNTSVGRYSLQANTTGANNTALGQSALYSNTTASNNTAVGYQALYNSNRTAGVGNNTAVGFTAGSSLTTGHSNTLLGFQAGGGLTTGIANTFIGGGVDGVLNGSGYAITTGSKNSILGNFTGNQGGLDIRTANNYIVLSDGDGNPRLSIPTGTATATVPNATGTVMVSGNMPAFSAYASSSTSLTANTATLIGFQTKVWDTATCYNNTGSTVTLNGLSVPAYAFCPNVAGYYQINGGWTTNSATLQSFYVSPYKNGSLYIYGNWQTGSAIGGVAICSSVVYLNGTGDYVQLYAVDSLSVGTSIGQQYTYFQASLIRTA